MARHREVYPTEQVIHLWAHQSQDHARNPSGNVFFNRKVIFSYRESWAMGYIHEKRPGAMSRCSVSGGPLLNSTVREAMTDAGVLVLTNSETYSVTTAKHQGWVDRAVSHLPRIAVAEIRPAFGAGSKLTKEQHLRNISQMERDIAAHLAKAQRAMQVSVAAGRSEAANRRHGELSRYMAFFGIRRKVMEYPAVAFTAAIQRAQAIETPDPIRDARKIKQREQRNAKARAELQSGFDAYCVAVATYNEAMSAAIATMPDASATWRATGQWPRIECGAPYPPINDPYGRHGMRNKWRAAGFEIPEILSVDRPDATLLRVQGEEIVTSQGARIPLAHASRLWQFVERVRASGIEYKRNGHTEYAGTFAVDRVTVDGDMTAGCHFIKYGELRLLAVALGFVTE